MAEPSSRKNDSAPAPYSFLGAPQQPDELGRLGKYRVLKLLGKGGMGMVFKAEDPGLQRTVALKMMLPAIATRALAKERFLREAQAAATIEHDHIISIHEVNEDRGIPFIAMSFLKGMSLDDWLKQKRPLSTSQILRIGREIAKGLSAAHERGLIHRDIKPANIWLDAAGKGRVKILDFGLARPEKGDTGLTRSGQIVGTPQYMSPEQAAGAKIDARSDLFSLGIVLYRLCTGVQPFRGDSIMAVLSALAVQEPEPVGKLNRDLPPAFADLITRLLRKDPAERPANARDIVDAIAAIERERMLAKLAPRPAETPSPIAAGPPPVILPSETMAPPTRAPSPGRSTFAFDEASDSFLSEEDFAFRSAESSRVAPRPTMPLIYVSAGVLCLVLLSLMVAMWWNRASRGTIELNAEGRDLQVFLKREDGKVITLDTSRPVSLPPGRYLAALARPDKDLVLEPDEFELKAAATQTLHVRLAGTPPGMFPAPRLSSTKKPPTSSTRGDGSARPPLAVAPFDRAMAAKHQGTWAAYLKLPVTQRNSIDMTLVLIPPGEFQMGANTEAFPDRGPQHLVRITRPYQMGLTEVTQAQFHRIMSHNPSFFHDRAGGGPDHPVENVGHASAEQFCRLLSQLPEEQKAGRRYRLPTEAEWEHAARAGTMTPSVIGGAIVPTQQVAQVNAFRTAPVGQFPANPWGLLDVHGNVWEWCQDHYDADYFRRSPLEDPTGPPLGRGWVSRGGAYSSNPLGCVIWVRDGATLTGSAHGFRVLCEVDEPTR